MNNPLPSMTIEELTAMALDAAAAAGIDGIEHSPMEISDTRPANLQEAWARIEILEGQMAAHGQLIDSLGRLILHLYDTYFSRENIETIAAGEIDNGG